MDDTLKRLITLETKQDDCKNRQEEMFETFNNRIIDLEKKYKSVEVVLNGGLSTTEKGLIPSVSVLTTTCARIDKQYKFLMGTAVIGFLTAITSAIIKFVIQV